MKVLVVAAWEPELTRFRELGGIAGVALHLETIGVGVVEAALGASRALLRHSPDMALLLGTAGSLPGTTLAIHDVVTPHSVRLLDAGLLAKRADLPPPLPANVALDVELPGARRVVVANTIGITTDDRLAEELASAGCEVEHLEVFAFARACAQAGVRCGAALGIANPVGSAGRAAWVANHVKASAAAAEVAWAALGALSPTET